MFTDNDGNRDWKKILYHGRSAFVVLLSLAILVGGAGFVGYKANNAWQSYRAETDYGDTTGTGDVQVTIPAGATGSTIAQLLAKADVVKSSKGFLKAYRANEQADTIQAGVYKLRTHISSATALEMLLDPKNQVHNRVTIPEGLWLSDTFALLSKKTGIPVAQFQKAAKDPQALGYPSYVDNLEGFVYPQTYEIGQKPTATSILKLAAAEFNKVARKNSLASGAESLGRDPLEVMTVASIVQAEATSKDGPMVAGIIYNRLKQGIPLGLDSTAHYQLQIPMNKPLPSGFQQEGTDSSYNTYANTGLPKGPIDSPGEKAIQAALHPTKSEYLYWLTVNFKTGETKFAKTLAEHNKNLEAWKAWCKTAKDKSGCPA